VTVTQSLPCVSVVMPAYNAEKFIAAAIESVLNQTFKDLEILVVDDGSRDGTAGVVARYPAVSYVAQKNAGASSARNRGVALARGEFIAFLDADDEWHPQKLAAQVALMRAYPAADLSRTAIAEEPLRADSPLFSAGSQALPDHIKVGTLAESFLNPYFATSAVMVRRAAFEAVGGFDTSLKIAEDVDLYLRILARAPVVPMVSGIALHKRAVKGSLGDDSEAGYVQLMAVNKRFLAAHPDAAQALGARVIKRAEAVLWTRYAGSLFRNGKRGQAIKAAFMGALTQPSVSAWRVLLRVMLP
jgi:glycosyltransferase involved in cell wall biosynthesis